MFTARKGGGGEIPSPPMLRACIYKVSKFNLYLQRICLNNNSNYN